MERLCRKAHVKPFGFHAIRHKSAAITFVSSGLNAARVLMGHYRATMTDLYEWEAIHGSERNSFGYGRSNIEQMVENLPKTKIPQKIIS